MTADEKALSIIEKWESGTYYGGAVQKKAALQVAIIQALKEQDRDTRHKCAETISQIEGTWKNDLYIGKHDAQAACMNAKAV